MLRKAQELLEAGKPADAASLLEESLAGAPDHPHLLLYAGLAQVDAGRVDEGFAALERACSVEPVDPLRRIFVARALYDVGRTDEAVEQCRRVEGVQPGHPGAVTLRLLCEGRNDPLLALTALSLLGLSGDPELQGRALAFAESVLAAGSIKAHASDTGLAQTGFDQGASPLWPEAAAPWNVHPGVEAALPELSGAGGAWLKRSQAMQAAGALDRAIVFGESAMREQGGDEARVHLAMLYFDAGRWAETEAALRGFLTDDPERSTLVGVSLVELGRFREAIPVLEKAEPDSARAAQMLGRARLITGDATGARRAFVRAARLDESIPAAQIAKAYLFCRAAVLAEA